MAGSQEAVVRRGTSFGVGGGAAARRRGAEEGGCGGARAFLPMNSSASAGVLMPSVVHSCSDAAIACAQREGW